MEEVLTLSCDNFDRKCPKAFRELWLDQELSDVTLATEDGGQIAAHKVILSTSSPLFKRLLQRNRDSHPLLYFMGIKLIEVEQLLSYIYLGKCDLTQVQLPAFMAAGKLLEIEGLVGDLDNRDGETLTDVKQEEKPVEQLEIFLQNQNHIAEDKLSNLDTNSTQNMDGGTQNQNFLIDENSHFASKGKDDTMTSQGYEEVAMSTNVKTIATMAAEPNNLTILGNEGQCPFCDYRPANRSNIKQHIKNVHQGLKYECSHCDFKSGDKSNLKKHIEKYHLGITYSCSICQKVLNSKDQLKRHVDGNHNGLRFYCPNCEYRSRNRSLLDEHISVHHNGMTFDCEI